jgi:beta-lactamase regulating signal transducer with metallopeptidase domain
MSLTGAFVVAAICLARQSIKKAPKIISYCLWAVAGFRLAFPFSIESVFSLVPFRAQTIPPDIATQSVPRIDSGIPFVNDAVGTMLASPPTAAVTGVSPLVLWTRVGTWVWLMGAAVMLIVGVVFYLRLKHKMASAIRVESNIYETDGIRSPFVLGLITPKIYVPLGLSGQERDYIILHEQTHIRRYDHIIKFAAYFILCLHWFNPLAWAAFLLMGLDMEMSCDERVLKELGGGLTKDYSRSLLSLATGRRLISGAPLAFGEDGVKKRIKNVLSFRKSSRVAVAGAIAFVSVLSLGLMVSKASTVDLDGLPAFSAKNLILQEDSEVVNPDTDDSSGLPGLDKESDGSQSGNTPGTDGTTTNTGTSTTSTGAATTSTGTSTTSTGAGTSVGGTNSSTSGNSSPTSPSGTPTRDPSSQIVDPNAGKTPDTTDTSSGWTSGRTYVLTDYYNNDGRFSALGLALDERNSEKVLTVSSGDILIVGGRQYEVTTQSLTLSAYPQPSLEQAIRWWTECLNGLAASGKVRSVG